jgi:hypothetical protein
LSRYLTMKKRSVTKNIRKYSNPSLHRSVSPTRSHSLSHSGENCRSGCHRFSETDFSKRPLVVSFRKPSSSSSQAGSCVHSSCSYTKTSYSSERLVYSFTLLYYHDVVCFEKIKLEDIFYFKHFQPLHCDSIKRLISFVDTICFK